ncbi:hypothetical protein JTB14_006962 [Gonioctena quinquepunctata]|nr:hypothetical protein JTB14_006962 [Gonioctena quinquepunctata]
MRYPVYMAVVAKAFDLRKILVLMSKINWEVRDVRSMHNSYIDTILKEVQTFTQYLEDVAVKVPISDDVYKNLWENIAHIVTHTLVQGFSGAKKCTNGGRALMQLDFTHFLMNFEKISSLRPVPHKEYVENYVKAYYLPDIELEKWIRQQKDYSSEHLFGLVSCTCQNNKKTKQRLLQVIEELEKNQFGREYHRIIEQHSTLRVLGKDWHAYDWKAATQDIIKLPGNWHFQFNPSKRFLLTRGNQDLALIQGEAHYRTNVGMARSVCKRQKNIVYCTEQTSAWTYC